ncbi:unnamed protein product, partial [Mesorhabditis belari]|uniref:Uncharacterized protein n=1 Tax=Mesorhabditis belari TaxID=2138241 RepID=A0AAF3FHS4_9BILA
MLDPACDHCSTWIGYYGHMQLGEGTWTDGTPVDYVINPNNFTCNWPQGCYWLMTNDEGCGLERDCRPAGSVLQARALCKKLAV